MAGPYVGVLRACGLAKETTLGTLKTPPDIFLPLIAPDSFTPHIPLIESKGLRFIPDIVYKVAQGAAEVKGMKAKIEAEPENIGQLLMAAFGTDTVSTVFTTVGNHIFTRASVAQLPGYSWWFDKGANFPQFVGCMCSKLNFTIKAKEFVQAESEWTALGYDSTGTSKSPTYSVRKPFVFNQAVVTVGGSGALNYDNIKIEIDNMVRADHTIASKIFPSTIYSEGLMVSVAMDLIWQDTTEWDKFRNGTSTSLTVVLTSSENIAGSSPTTPYSLTFTIPNLFYSAAPLAISQGLMKVSFTGRAVYNTGTTQTMNATLQNSVLTGY